MNYDLLIWFLAEDDPQRIETCCRRNVLNIQLYADNLYI